MSKKHHLIFTFFLSFFLSIQGFSQAIDTLTRVINEAETDTERIRIYLNAANNHWLSYNQGKAETIIRYAQSAKKLAIKIDNKEAAARAHNMIADVHLKQGNITEALEENLAGLDIANELNDDLLIFDFHNALGIFHGTLRELSKAMHHFEAALEIAEKDGLEYLKPNILVNLGMGHTRLNNPEKALELQLEALSIQEKIKDTSDEILHTLTGIGETYRILNDNKNAIIFYLKGEKYLEGNELQAASRIYEGLSICYSNEGDFFKGIKYGKKAVEAGEKLGDPSWLSSAYQSLSDDYEKAGLYKEALEAHKKYQITYAQLFDQEQSDKAKELEVQYDVRQKKIENEFLEKQLKQRNIVVFIIFILLIVLAFTAYLFFQNARNKASFNKRLKEEVIMRTKELNEANSELKQSYSELESYTYIASHDLKEPLRSIVSFSSLLERKLKSNPDNSVREYLEFIKNSANQMNELIVSILELGVMRGQKMKLEEVDLNDLLLEIAEKNRLDIQKHNAILNFKNLPKVKGDKNGLERVFLSLISNGIKFNKSEVPTIDISAFQETDKFRIAIQDNGIGIEEAYHEQVFEMYKRLHNRSEYTGSGAGLTISKRIIEAHESDIQIKSQIEKGSTFSFLLESV